MPDPATQPDPKASTQGGKRPAQGAIDPLATELAPECALMRSIYIMSHMMMRVLDRVAQPAGLTGSRWLLLVNVRDADEPMTITQLSAHLCISPQNVSRMATTLESEGLITRDTTGPGRTVRISLTELGKARLDTCEVDTDSCGGRILDGVSEEEIAGATRTIERMIRNTAAMEDDPLPEPAAAATKK